MKPVRMLLSSVVFLFLLFCTNAATVSGSNKNNETSNQFNNSKSVSNDDISTLLEQFDPSGAASDNFASVTTLTSDSKNNADTPFVTGSTVTSTSSSPTLQPGTGFPPPSVGNAHGSYNSRFSNLGLGASPPPLGGVGIPFGGFAGFPGAGAGGSVGIDIGVGGGIIEKAIVVVGGGILILLGLAAAQAFIAKGALFHGLGDGFATSNLGGIFGDTSDQKSVLASSESATLSKTVNEAIDRRF